MLVKPVESKTIIVLLGSFNPLIFLPSWFARHGILGEEEGEKAEIDVVHREILRFSTSRLTVLVEQGRFIAEIDQPPDIQIMDFVLKTFGEVLVHTPIWIMGINKRVVVDAGSADNRDKIGTTLAPPEAWGEWATDIRKRTEKEKGGMVSITMRQRVTDDRPQGYIQARVEPAKKSDSAVFVEVNDHYELENKEEVQGCLQIMDLLSDRFDASIKRSEWIIDQVMGIAK